MEEADTQNTPFQNQIDLHCYQLNTLRRLNDLGDQNQGARQVLSSRSTSTPKLALPRLNGNLLQW